MDKLSAAARTAGASIEKIDGEEATDEMERLA
jgi:hypothetical protein